LEIWQYEFPKKPVGLIKKKKKKKKKKATKNAIFPPLSLFLFFLFSLSFSPSLFYLFL